jgi:fibronectin-binding autotransporter adhesin
MAGYQITSKSSGVVLSNSTTQNPATVVAFAYVTNTTTLHSGDAIYGTTAAAWNITNLGTIRATATASSGLALEAGGTVTNAASARIAGVVNGVYIGGSAGTVTNSGTILSSGTAGAATGVVLKAGGTIINSGTIGGGNGTAISFGGTGGNRLVLDPGYHLGGTVVGTTGAGATNTLELASAATAGTVSAALATEFVSFTTVTVDSAAQWTLTGSSSLSGITLTDLGTLTNAGKLTGTGALIVDPATLINSGYIGLTVSLTGGGYLGNASTGTIAVAGTAVYGTGGAATIVNAGTVNATGTAGVGVDLTGGGGVNNASATALIAGYVDGVYIRGNAPTVANSGMIEGTGTSSVGVFLRDGSGGTVSNSGTILGTGPNSDGIDLPLGGGSIINNSTGTIAGVSFGIEDFGPGEGTVINYGIVTGTYVTGVDLDDGSMTNFGTITAESIGVYQFGGQVTNYGNDCGFGHGERRGQAF